MCEVVREHVVIPSPRGALAGEMAYPMDGVAVADAALVVNPHPHMGGRMDNKLVVALAAGLAEAGLVTLRFDYAAGPEGPDDLAASMEQFWTTGTAPEDPLLVEDARVARDWLRRETRRPTTLVGYSFGAFVATQLCDDDVPAVVLVTPTIDHHDFASFRNDGLPTLVVHSDDDFATGEDRTQAWSASLPEPAQVRVFPGADHFFRGRENAVAAVCAEFVLGAGRVPAGGPAR